MSFKTVEQEVKAILKKNQQARCDDMKLYACYVYEKVQGKGVSEWLLTVFSDKKFRIINGIAPYETVSRVRRKLQEEHEELKAPGYIIQQKKEQERAYRMYARGLSNE